MNCKAEFNREAMQEIAKARSREDLWRGRFFGCCGCWGCWVLR